MYDDVFFLLLLFLFLSLVNFMKKEKKLSTPIHHPLRLVVGPLDFGVADPVPAPTPTPTPVPVLVPVLVPVAAATNFRGFS